MKQIKQALLFFALFFSVAFVGRQVPKKLKVELPLDNWNVIINIINDAPLQGDYRRAIIKSLTDQLEPQLAKDSTKTKK